MTPTTISMKEALAKLPELVARGEEVVIAVDGHPIAKVVPFDGASRGGGGRRKRVFGQYRGKIHLSDDFDAPLPDDFWLGRDVE